MFARLGRFIARTWIVLLVAWVALLAGVRWAAPEWESVIESGEFAFLPADAPSRRAEELLARAFPDRATGSSIVVVVRRAAAELSEQDREFIQVELLSRLERLLERDVVAGVRAPGDAGASALLVSEDGRARLLVVELTREFLDSAVFPIVRDVETLLDELRREGAIPAELDVALTGSAVIGRDTQRARAQSAEAIELWTILLIVGLLVVVYRAPFLALIPLATLYVALQVALGLLAMAAGAGWVGLFEGIDIYTTVIAFGAGVDYTLFLTARYQEELQRGADLADGLTAAIGKAGPAVGASSGTELFGIGMMVFATFGKFQQAGIAIAFALFVVLAASLTFSMPLLRLAGRYAFWPRRTLERDRGPRLLAGVWDRLGRAIERRPGTIWLGTVLVMGVPATAGVLLFNTLSYGMLSELPGDMPSVQGTRLLARHFPAGSTGTLAALIHDDEFDFRQTGPVETLTDRLWQRREGLHLADLRSVTEPLGRRVELPGVTEADGALAVLMRRAGVRRHAIAEYVSQTPGPPGPPGLEHRVTRLELVLDLDPFSPAAIRHLDDLQRAVRAELPAPLRDRAEVSWLGPTASLRDLKRVGETDRVRILVLVAGAVFAVLALLLRAVWLPLYLIASVAFSYLATLGVTFGVFWLLDPSGFDGLDWTVPIFLFTVLIAVGEDYNIFLVTRVREEQERHGPIAGVRVALAKTGRIISSCGLIMGGTFASLLVGGRLAGMQQLGFALAFGVLLDTFVVRPVLVPAWLVMMARRRESRRG